MGFEPKLTQFLRAVQFALCVRHASIFPYLLCGRPILFPRSPWPAFSGLFVVAGVRWLFAAHSEAVSIAWGKFRRRRSPAASGSIPNVARLTHRRAMPQSVF